MTEFPEGARVQVGDYVGRVHRDIHTIAVRMDSGEIAYFVPSSLHLLDQPAPQSSVDLSALVRKWRRQGVEPRNAGIAESVYDECAAELDAILDLVRQAPPNEWPKIAVAMVNKTCGCRRCEDARAAEAVALDV